jgi:hypothetical protein
VTVTDDRTGVTYGAISKVGATDEELTLAARMIRRAQAMQAANPPDTQGFAFQIELMNLMRIMYDIFGRYF